MYVGVPFILKSFTNFREYIDVRLSNIFKSEYLLEQHEIIDNALSRLSSIAFEKTDVLAQLDQLDIEMKNGKLTERVTCECVVHLYIYITDILTAHY